MELILPKAWMPLRTQHFGLKACLHFIPFAGTVPHPRRLYRAGILVNCSTAPPQLGSMILRILFFTRSWFCVGRMC